jgi:hypothetical protein
VRTAIEPTFTLRRARALAESLPAPIEAWQSTDKAMAREDNYLLIDGTAANDSAALGATLEKAFPAFKT